MQTNISKKDNNIIVEFIGRLDTPAAQGLSKEVSELQKDADKTITIDCTNLEYISSSGLRIFLSLKKATAQKGGKVIVKNINNEIRSVFMMTGFLNLFEIV